MDNKKKKIQTRDPEKTKASILEHAIQIFAKNGFHGTGLNEICSRAKVNKRMIYHYFGNKNELYRAVHLSGWEELQVWFMERLQAGKSDNVLFEALSTFHDFISSHQLFVRLLMWDGLEGGTISRSLWKEVRGPIYHLVQDLVVNAQKTGQISSDLDPGHLVITFMGAIAFYFSHAHTMVDIFHKQTLSPEAIEERKDQILKLFTHILKE